ncbi:MAG: hypothetical protein Roseis2KO_07050 [Roseivirga sp.]
MCKYGYCLLLSLLYYTASSQIVRVENDGFSTDSTGWNGTVELNINTVKNNSEFFRLATGSQLRYTQKASSYMSVNELRMVIAGPDNLENRGFQHFRFQHIVDSTFTIEAFSQAQFDEPLKIGVRLLQGVGVRTSLADTEKSQFYLGTAYMYEYEEEDETGIINRNSRISSYLTFNKELEKSNFHVVVYYQPRVARFSDLRVSGRATLSFRIGKNLTFNVGGELIHDSNPVEGVTQLTYTTNSGFMWKF